VDIIVQLIKNLTGILVNFTIDRAECRLA